MKKLTVIVFFAFYGSKAFSQVEDPVRPGSKIEQQLENLTEQQEGEPEDDSYIQELFQFNKNPLNINTADESDLKKLRVLTALQIESFLKYRRLLGSLLSIYELQAIPGWDVETIQKVLPYIRVGNAVTLSASIRERFKGGQNSLLLRSQQVLEKSNGYLRTDSIANRYLGSRQRLFFRYKYNYRNLLQFGVTGDKDAGEQLFKGNQKAGFDFYSFHFFARKLGAIKLLAIGDFTVNLGQGLIHWQSLAFKKSPEITAVKRQADILRPYNSAGEYNFERGVGITVGLKPLDFTAFASVRKLDGTVNDDTSQINNDIISSIAVSGYHRTPNEIAKKNTLTQTAVGGNVSYSKNGFHFGINGVAYKFSAPLVRDLQPYNQYAVQGENWYNSSFDYGYTYRNVHLFGEAAFDKNNAKALLTGLLASLDPKVDASLVYRNIQKTYQTLYGNAFTEGSLPTNESGLFAGVSIKPASYLKIDAYADIFSFPWLRYRVDAPGKGSEYLVQLTYQPNKRLNLYTRFRNENKAINLSGLNLQTRQPYIRPRINWRTELSYKIISQLSFRNRVELVWFDPYEKARSQNGFLTYFDARYKPLGTSASINGRIQYFTSEGSDSRLYAFESDVLYSYSIPQFTGKGFRYYVNLNYDLTKKLTCWVRWSQTIYAAATSIGAGLDEIKGNKRSEIKLQFLYLF